MAFKPRIVITIATADSFWELSTVKGREMANGSPSPGPSKKQIKIASRAIRDIVAADDKHTPTRRERGALKRTT